MNIPSITLRRLAESPAFTLSIVLLLALGIGASSAIFSIVDTILFRRLTLPEPESLVRVFPSDPQGNDLRGSSSFPVYRDYVEQSSAFEGLAAFTGDIAVNLATGNELPQRVLANVVSGSFFPLLHVRAAHGRLIAPDDDQRNGGHPVVVLTDRFWRERFGADPAVIGRAVRLNGTPFTIVGITTPDFGGVSLESTPDLYVPISFAATAIPAFANDGIPMFETRQFSWIQMIGRLAPGVTLEEAQTQLRMIAARRAARQPPRDRDPSATLVSAERAALDLDTQGTTARISWFLLAFVLLVLLISGLDAGGLLLARVRRRRRDLAVRLALGASRRRLIGEILAESLALSLAGAACGIGVAALLRNWLFTVAARELPYPIEAARPLEDVRVLLFTSATAIAVAILMALFPAVIAVRTNVITAIKSGGAAERPRLRRLRLRTGDLFLVAQIAVSVAVLVATGLVLRTILNLNRVRPGFDADHAVATSIDLSRQGYAKDRALRVLDEIRARTAALPGIEAAGFGRTVPIQRSGMRMTVKVPGRPSPSFDGDSGVDLNIVTPGFFRAMGIPLLAGRDFLASDRNDGRLVCIISENLARHDWPGENAIGKTFADVGPNGTEAEVVGIAGDVKYRSLREPAPETLYLPVTQFYNGSMTLVVRSTRPAQAVLADATRVIAQIDPDMPTFAPRTLHEKVRASMLQERMIGSLLSLFGAIALLLTMAGIAGVLLYGIASRVKELGIRTAIGAEPGALRALILRRSAALLAAGSIAGLVLAGAFTRLTTGLLFGVVPNDPLTFACAALLLFAAGLGAALWPAQRAATIDPLVALREE